MKDKRYINERIGISLKSTFLHSLRSSSGVRVGGGGRLDSPPKSTLSEAMLPRFSSNDGTDPFSPDMVEMKESWEGDQSPKRIGHLTTCAPGDIQNNAMLRYLRISEVIL